MDTSLSLYVIAEEQRDLFAAIAEAEGELTPELLDRWNAIQGVPQKKLEQCALYALSAESVIASIKAEQDRLNDLRKTREAALMRFRQYVQKCMETLGVVKIEGDLVRLTIAKNPPALKIASEDAIPPEFYVEKTICELDKAALKEAVKSGREIDGVTITQGTSLRIK